MKEKIGIFGGTFNPIHLGHVKAASEVQKKVMLDRILFIPSHIPPHKGSPEIASPFHRLKMVELAVAPYPLFFPSSVEIDAKGKSYSILTLKKLKKRFTQSTMFFILGIDAFLEIETWREYRKLLDQCHFIVISRPGYKLEDAVNVLEGGYRDRMIQDIDTWRGEDSAGRDYRIFLLSIPALDMASKDIRYKVRSGQSIDGLVAAPVKHYIESNNLYQ